MTDSPRMRTPDSADAVAVLERFLDRMRPTRQASGITTVDIDVEELFRATILCGRTVGRAIDDRRLAFSVGNGEVRIYESQAARGLFRMILANLAVYMERMLAPELTVMPDFTVDELDAEAMGLQKVAANVVTTRADLRADNAQRRWRDAAMISLVTRWREAHATAASKAISPYGFTASIDYFDPALGASNLTVTTKNDNRNPLSFTIELSDI